MKPRHRIAHAVMAAIGLVALMALSAGPANACACCGTYKVVNVEHWDVLNVRSGPGVQYQIIAMLKPGEGCIVPSGEYSGNWMRIDAHGKTGWVNSYYLARIPG